MVLLDCLFNLESSPLFDFSSWLLHSTLHHIKVLLSPALPDCFWHSRPQFHTIFRTWVYWELLLWPKCSSLFLICNSSVTEHQFPGFWNGSTDTQILPRCPSSCSSWWRFHRCNSTHRGTFTNWDAGFGQPVQDEETSFQRKQEQSPNLLLSIKCKTCFFWSCLL